MRASAVPLETLVRWRREILAGTGSVRPASFSAVQALMDRPAAPDQTLDGICGPPEVGAVLRLPSCGQRGPTISASATRRCAARRRSLKAAGADMIKMYGLMSKELYFLIAAEARRVGLPSGATYRR